MPTGIYKHKPLSKKTRDKISLLKQGVRHPMWKGGYLINTHGYRIVYIKPETYILEHRKIMEKYLRRKLLPTEYVHHINGKRADNRIGNLKLITNSKHISIHRRKNNPQKYHNLKWLKVQLLNGKKQSDIARICNVSPTAISRFIIRYLKRQ